MRTIYIDCEGAKSADEVWQRYVDAVNPANAAVFGRNLDAFWDAVEYGSPGWPGPVKLVFLHSQRLATLRTRNGLSLFAGLRQIADEATQTSIELA
ncbi:barstar family protein [Novosphingobium pokkalii]